MLEKITKIYSRQGAASKMFRGGGANSCSSPVDSSQIGKYTSLGQFVCSKYNSICIFASKPPVLETLSKFIKK